MLCTMYAMRSQHTRYADKTVDYAALMLAPNPDMSRVSGKPVGRRMNKGFAAFAPHSNLHLWLPLLVKYPG